MTDFRIRPILPTDNGEIERIIRACLIEYGANHEGTAWTDPDLGRFSELYAADKTGYWVAEDLSGRLVGGVGIGPLSGYTDICELQKMYCIPKARGTGVSHMLLKTALDFAGKYYRKVYLETLPNMQRAQAFYQKFGFERLASPLSDTGHFACDVCLMKEL